MENEQNVINGHCEQCDKDNYCTFDNKQLCKECFLEFIARLDREVDQLHQQSNSLWGFEL